MLFYVGKRLEALQRERFDYVEIRLEKTADPEKIFAIHINNADNVPENGIGLDERCFCNRAGIDLTIICQS